MSQSEDRVSVVFRSARLASSYPIMQECGEALIRPHFLWWAERATAGCVLVIFPSRLPLPFFPSLASTSAFFPLTSILLTRSRKSNQAGSVLADCWGWEVSCCGWHQKSFTSVWSGRGTLNMQSVDTLGLIYLRKFTQPHLILVLDSSSYCFLFTILPHFFLARPHSCLIVMLLLWEEKRKRKVVEERCLWVFCHVCAFCLCILQTCLKLTALTTPFFNIFSSPLSLFPHLFPARIDFCIWCYFGKSYKVDLVAGKHARQWYRTCRVSRFVWLLAWIICFASPEHPGSQVGTSLFLGFLGEATQVSNNCVGILHCSFLKCDPAAGPSSAASCWTGSSRRLTNSFLALK